MVFKNSEFMGRICDWFGFRLVFSDVRADSDAMCGILHMGLREWQPPWLSVSMAVSGGMCVKELAVAHTVPISGFVYVFIFLSRVKNSPDVSKRHRVDVVFVLA